MAIDGVKIIDSDQGYDIYNEVVGRYRDGDHVANIIKDILDAEKDYCQTDFFTEIYWTALAYSLWKIGHLTDDIRDKTLELIKKGADPFWLEIDSKALKQRQKVLDKLAIQLQTENPRPLKVKPKLYVNLILKKEISLLLSSKMSMVLSLYLWLSRVLESLSIIWLAHASYKPKSPPSMIF